MGNEVEVTGMPWCKGKSKRIGISSHTRKMLCLTHNHRLSVVDAEAIKAFDSFRRMTILANNRTKDRWNAHRWKTVEYHIDGPLFERWLLKCLINMTFGGRYPLGNDRNEPGMPPKDLVDIVFGHANFSGRAGAYFVIRKDEEISSTETLDFTSLIKDRAYVAGACYRFRGVRLLLFLSDVGPPEPLTGISISSGEDFGDAQLNYHNKRIDFEQFGVMSQSIHFHW